MRVVHDGGRSEIVGMDLGKFWKLLRVLERLGKVKAVGARRLEPLSVVSHQYKSHKPKCLAPIKHHNPAYTPTYFISPHPPSMYP